MSKLKPTLRGQMRAAMSRLVDVATEVGMSKTESEFNRKMEKLFDVFDVIEEMDDDFSDGKGKQWGYYSQLLRKKENERNRK